MTRRLSSSKGKGFFNSAIFFLFFATAFGSLFYLLREQDILLERGKIERYVQILSIAIRNDLRGNEKFFLRESRQASLGESTVQLQCERYLAAHPEIVIVEARSGRNTSLWRISPDPSLSNLSLIPVDENNLVSQVDQLDTLFHSAPLDSLQRSSVTRNAVVWFLDSMNGVAYARPIRFGKGYYCEARIRITENGIPSGSLSFFTSIEKLLGEVLKRNPMEGYNVALSATSGESIASTGISNAEVSFRGQGVVEDYDRLFSIEVSNPAYSFWTFGMILGAVLCGVLSLVVFAVTFVLGRDVEKMKRARSSLQASEVRFRTIFENSADAMRLMDRYGRITMVNSAYCDLVKSSHDELLREFKEGDEGLEQRYAANATFRSQFDAGTLKMASSQMIRQRDGTEVPVEASHSLIDVGKGEKLLLSIFRDVSERQKHELESQQVQKMDALGEFAVGIGNNLKNIVGIVMNSAEVISRDSSGSAELAEYVEMIVRESKRASELADDLLVFARSKSGAEQPIAVEKIIHQVQRILEHSLSPTIKWLVVEDHHHAVITGDIHLLHQAIVNVALDVQHRMPTGGAFTLSASIADPSVVRRKLPAMAEREFIAIEIFDDGMELDEVAQRRIFEPFFSARTADYATGLRLSVVYGIVRKHGGFVDVKSEKGKGTKFSLFFPVAYHEEGAESAVASPPPQGGTECVLMVDDEESYRQIYEHGLAHYGYKVYTANGGEEAFAFYEEHRSEIDLVVSDLMMPSMNGEELFHKLREHNPSIRMILATGAIDLKAKSELLDAGLRDVIAKPFSLDEMAAAMRKALDAGN